MKENTVLLCLLLMAMFSQAFAQPGQTTTIDRWYWSTGVNEDYERFYIFANLPNPAQNQWSSVHPATPSPDVACPPDIQSCTVLGHLGAFIQHWDDDADTELIGIKLFCSTGGAEGPVQIVWNISLNETTVETYRDFFFGEDFFQWLQEPDGINRRIVPIVAHDVDMRYYPELSYPTYDAHPPFFVYFNATTNAGEARFFDRVGISFEAYGYNYDVNEY